MNRSSVIGSENREEVFGFIVRYIKQHGYAPSAKEIGEGVGISKESARRHVIWLIEDGYLQTDAEPGEARAYRITGTKVIKVVARKVKP